MKVVELKVNIEKILDDNKAKSISTIDLRNKSYIADYMIVASGTSSRHLQSLSEILVSELKRKGYKFPGYNKEIFCDWYIKILEKINNEERLNKKVLFLNFEDFVIKKQDTISKIFNHIESEQIEFNKVDFNFSRCENNINVFKKELNKNEIEYIEKKLKTFLYPF